MKDNMKLIVIVGIVAAIIIVLGVFVLFTPDTSDFETVTTENTNNELVIVTTEAAFSDETTEVSSESDDAAEDEDSANDNQSVATETADDAEIVESGSADWQDVEYIEYSFRNRDRLSDHYEKHGKEMGFDSPEAYEDAASDVVNNPEALHKTEKEDGDDVYYIEKTNEFVVVSSDGYIRTYFYPSGGINYYNRQ